MIVFLVIKPERLVFLLPPRTEKDAEPMFAGSTSLGKSGAVPSVSIEAVLTNHLIDTQRGALG